MSVGFVHFHEEVAIACEEEDGAGAGGGEAFDEALHENGVDGAEDFKAVAEEEVVALGAGVVVEAVQEDFVVEAAGPDAAFVGHLGAEGLEAAAGAFVGLVEEKALDAAEVGLEGVGVEVITNVGEFVGLEVLVLKDVGEEAAGVFAKAVFGGDVEGIERRAKA